MKEYCGHWEGMLNAYTNETIVILDIFEDEMLLSFPNLHIFGLRGRYYLYGNNLNFSVELEHPMIVNSILDIRANLIYGVLTQMDTCYDFKIHKTSLPPIMSDINDKNGYYRSLLQSSVISLEQYSAISDSITYDVITKTISEKILNLYNVRYYEITNLEILIDLMHIVHNKFSHTIDFKPDFPVNAINIVDHQITKINCRAYAIIFNELALSVGFKSRYVTCLPYKDWEDDCHVVNEVYIDELKKWVFADANIGTLIMNADGDYLNIFEYRDALFHGKKCTLLDNASYNGNKMSIEEYDAYMVKNMYKFEYKIRYGFDSERNKKITLIPLIVKE